MNNNITWEQAKKVIEIFEILQALPETYGNKYSYEVSAEYRKNEYVFGITLKCDLGGNLKIEDYASVLFADSDENTVDLEEFETLKEEILKFQDKVQKLKSVNQ